MGGKIRVELDYSGFTAYRQSPGVRSLLNSEAERIASLANKAKQTKRGKYSTSTARDSRYGSVALVQADNIQARVDNAKNKTLLRVTRGG